MMNATVTIRLGNGNGPTKATSLESMRLLREFALDDSGGYTHSIRQGGWRDPDTNITYTEGVFELTFDTTHWQSTHDALVPVLEEIKELTGEQCIYVNVIRGNTLFI